MCAAMEQSGEVPALTTSGALVEALDESGARRIALVTPYTRSVTTALEEFLAEGRVAVTGRANVGLTRKIWKVPYRDVVDMAREAVVGAVDALFISCTNLPTYDVIPQLEAELRMPVLSANQVAIWARGKVPTVRNARPNLSAPSLYPAPAAPRGPGETGTLTGPGRRAAGRRERHAD
jgi:maleate isomerase